MNKTKKIGITTILILGIGIVYIYFFQHLKLKVPCIFHKLTGFYCPGCGLTRCLNALFHLEFYQAFRFNALFFLFLPVFLFYVIVLIYSKLKKQDGILKKWFPDWTWYLLLVITILFGILRNIPFFDWLAPTLLTLLN